MEQLPLELRDLTTGYGDVPVVRTASMRFPRRLITTIIGSNGAGKSTVIKAAAGLLRVWNGSVVADGVDITHEAAWRRVGRGIRYVPQGRVVVPEMSVRDNLEIGAHILKGDRGRIDAAMQRVTQLFPMLAQRLGQLAGTMSGGEQQMLVIGRALMAKPRLLLLDEPSLGVAPKIVQDIARSIVAINRDEKVSVLLVEQNSRMALRVSNRAYALTTGSIALSGASSDLAKDERIQHLYLGGDL